MPRFTGIGHFDLSRFYAAFTAKHRRGLLASESPLHKGARYLSLVNDGEKEPLIGDWPSAAALLQRIEATLAALPRPARLMNAFVLAFDAGGFEQWHEDDQIDPDSFMRVHTLLHPAPGFRLHSGAEILAPAPWTGFAVDHRAPVAQTNFDAPGEAAELVLELALDVGD